MINSNSKLHNTQFNIGRLLPVSIVNGPGRRFVLWLKGCSIRCPHCMNDDLLFTEPAQMVFVHELFERIMRTPDIEGITFSGGEPFDQPAAMLQLCTMIKKENLTIMSYSGYTYHELITSNDDQINKILLYLDILIDGRFKQQEAAPLLWRSSRNQNVYFFTDIYEQYKKIIHQEAMDMELFVKDQKIFITGNFNQEIFEQISKKLKDNYGIILSKKVK